MESHDFENDIGLRVLQNAYQNHPGTNVYHYLIKGQIKTNKIILIKHKNNTILKNITIFRTKYTYTLFML